LIFVSICIESQTYEKESPEACCSLSGEDCYEKESPEADCPISGEGYSFPKSTPSKSIKFWPIFSIINLVF